MTKLTRHSFITTATVTASTAVPLFNITKAGAKPSSTVNVAGIGVTGRGIPDLKGAEKAGANIVALCDVWDDRMAETAPKYPDAKRFKDFRVMFDKMGKDIDAVLVSTPDHTHFVAAMEAMQRGRHVYVQKPLTHNIWQARTLQRAAHYYKVTTQMGNQGHATDGIRRGKEWTDMGLLGNVTRVDAAMGGRKWSPTSTFWRKPDSFPPKTVPVPKGLDWELWQGPTKHRPFTNYYVPKIWRPWYELGCGMLGDWACHTLDLPFWALDLGMPTVIEPEERDESPKGFMPDTSIIRFEFPARGDKPPVTLRWYEGHKPEPQPEWGDYAKGAMIMTGDKRCLVAGGKPGNPYIAFPGSKKDMYEFKQTLPKEGTIPRVEGPYNEWLDHITGNGPLPGSNFDYSARLTEVVLLGVLAQRFNTRIEWDAKRARITNNPKLNTYLKEPVNKGWEYGKEVWA